MFRFPVQLHQICGPISITVVACLLFFAEDFIGAIFIYERPEIANWQLWRLITGNLLHSNLNHLLLNLLGLVLLWALHGDYYTTRRYMFIFTCCAIATTLGLYLFNPGIYWYVGLSGALHGIFVWGAVVDIQHKLTSGWLLLLGVAIKIGYEQMYGASAVLAEWIAASVATDAHLYGAVGGLMVGVLSIAMQSQNRQKQNGE
ncbi:rhombosortase [Aestuariibacter salexigens]|uniref:rhombosortase n=1 Tax=Aestuariibacter salexigens TaxID=226010 RepID=UPI000687699D|nr:rhombosortase [Aestuariibacter salexigens]